MRPPGCIIDVILPHAGEKGACRHCIVSSCHRVVRVRYVVLGEQPQVVSGTTVCTPVGLEDGLCAGRSVATWLERPSCNSVFPQGSLPDHGVRRGVTAALLFSSKDSRA